MDGLNITNKCAVYVVLFHTITAECEGTKENNHEDGKQRLKRALAIDILVITLRYNTKRYVILMMSENKT